MKLVIQVKGNEYNVLPSFVFVARNLRHSFFLSLSLDIIWLADWYTVEMLCSSNLNLILKLFRTVLSEYGLNALFLPYTRQVCDCDYHSNSNSNANGTPNVYNWQIRVISCHLSAI